MAQARRANAAGAISADRPAAWSIQSISGALPLTGTAAAVIGVGHGRGHAGAVGNAPPRRRSRRSAPIPLAGVACSSRERGVVGLLTWMGGAAATARERTPTDPTPAHRKPRIAAGDTTSLTRRVRCVSPAGPTGRWPEPTSRLRDDRDRRISAPVSPSWLQVDVDNATADRHRQRQAAARAGTGRAFTAAGTHTITVPVHKV